MNKEPNPIHNSDAHNSQPILKKSKKGFAGMSKEKRTEIASKGGKRAHALGVAHKITSEEASHAGRIGGESIGKNREHMSSIGKKGSSVRWKHKHAADESKVNPMKIEKGDDTAADRAVKNDVTEKDQRE